MPALELREIPRLINFRTYVKSELREIESKLHHLRNNVDPLKLWASHEVKEGSRVTFTRGAGKPVDGRVLSVRRGIYSVHRDGFVGTINAFKDDLVNLSISQEAELERQIWVLEWRKEKLLGHLEDAEVPVALLVNDYNFINVIDVPLSYGSYNIITFVSSMDNHSYQLKISVDLIRTTGYYQIEMEDDDIKSVLKSTKEIFESNIL